MSAPQIEPKEAKMTDKRELSPEARAALGRLVNVNDPEQFDPYKHVTFRGRPITDLTREELLEALAQALAAVHALNSIRY